MVLPQIAYMPKSDMMSWRVSNLLNFHGVVRSTNNPLGLFSRACVRTVPGSSGYWSFPQEISIGTIGSSINGVARFVGTEKMPLMHKREPVEDRDIPVTTYYTELSYWEEARRLLVENK